MERRNVTISIEVEAETARVTREDLRRVIFLEFATGSGSATMSWSMSNEMLSDRYRGTILRVAQPQGIPAGFRRARWVVPVTIETSLQDSELQDLRVAEFATDRPERCPGTMWSEPTAERDVDPLLCIGTIVSCRVET